MNILFVCSRNRLRSPTAEQIFASHPGVEVASAGINPDADHQLDTELVLWADLIFVMERAHKTRMQRRYRSELKDKRLICLNIPDLYDFMDAKLVLLLKARVTPFLPT